MHGETKEKSRDIEEGELDRRKRGNAKGREEKMDSEILQATIYF